MSYDPSSHECCQECQTRTFFWEVGCGGTATLSPLMQEFAETHKEELRQLRQSWNSTRRFSVEEMQCEAAMKTLYHDFLAARNLTNFAEEMANVNASFASLAKSEAEAVAVRVAVTV